MLVEYLKKLFFKAYLFRTSLRNLWAQKKRRTEAALYL